MSIESLPESSVEVQRDAALTRAVKITLLVVGVGAVCWMLGAVYERVHNTVVVLILSVLFSYVVYPPIRALATRGVPIALAGVIVYIVLASLVLGAVAWLAPAIASQATELAHSYPALVAQTQAQLSDPAHSPLLARLPEGIRTAIAANAGKAATLAGGAAGAFGAHALLIVSGTTAALVNIGLIFGITLLMISELNSIHAFARRLIPVRHREAAVSFIDEVDAVVGGFVRGQILLALSVAVAGTIVLMAVGIPYALLLGLLAGIVSIIPMIGPIIAFLPVLLIAFFTVGLGKMLIVAALYAVIIGIQQNVLVPIFVARSVGISGFVVFVALLLGSESYGIMGALLSIPIAGILRVTSERVFPEDQMPQKAPDAPIPR